MKALPKDPLEGFPLKRATSPEWVQTALGDLDSLLADHAHCELKAAVMTMALVGRYPERTRLVVDFTALAREEMRHFEQVHHLIRERGKVLRRVETDPYVKQLSKRVCRGFHGAPGLMDQLLVCSFVEARSCERFRMLARSELPAGLSAFYADLAVAEARHHELFYEHAVEAVGEEVANRRAREVAEILSELPILPRMH